jgi:hypothetical protein
VASYLNTHNAVNTSTNTNKRHRRNPAPVSRAGSSHQHPELSSPIKSSSPPLCPSTNGVFPLHLRSPKSRLTIPPPLARKAGNNAKALFERNTAVPTTPLLSHPTIRIGYPDPFPSLNDKGARIPGPGDEPAKFGVFMFGLVCLNAEDTSRSVGSARRFVSRSRVSPSGASLPSVHHRHFTRIQELQSQVVTRREVR